MSSRAASTVADQGLDFEHLARIHWKALHGYAQYLSGDVHIAEDLVQESLLRAWRFRAGMRNPAAALGWLKTIVRRENARRFERGQKREQPLPAAEISAGHQTYDTSTEAFVLRRAMRALPPEYREPLVLQVLHGLSQHQIATRLGLSPAGVGTRLFRARKKLRELLGERL
jgi:RNA polymerase sigma-70 factor (ECF subfamily)